MSYVLRGDIESKDGHEEKAKDAYRKVLRDANKNTEKLQIARANLGLAEIYIFGNDWPKAQPSLEEIKRIDLADFKEEREKLTRLAAKLPGE